MMEPSILFKSIADIAKDNARRSYLRTVKPTSNIYELHEVLAIPEAPEVSCSHWGMFEAQLNTNGGPRDGDISDLNRDTLTTLHPLVLEASSLPSEKALTAELLELRESELNRLSIKRLEAEECEKLKAKVLAHYFSKGHELGYTSSTGLVPMIVTITRGCVLAFFKPLKASEGQKVYVSRQAGEADIVRAVQAAWLIKGY